jgi:tetratricopeptide (TPR) repeat protein
MRCNYQLKKYPDAIDYAQDVISVEKINTELIYKSHYIIAQSQLATQQYDEALPEFQTVVNTAKNELGAESHYLIAYINYLKKDYKKSEKTIFDFLKGNGEYATWVTKSLILLADNYVALGDNFQAKTTLKSVISDSDIPELIKTAQEKLDKIIAQEEAEKQAKLIPLEPLKVEFKGDTTEQKRLFNNDTLVAPKMEEPKHD